MRDNSQLNILLKMVTNDAHKYLIPLSSLSLLILNIQFLNINFYFIFLIWITPCKLTYPNPPFIILHLLNIRLLLLPFELYYLIYPLLYFCSLYSLKLLKKLFLYYSVFILQYFMHHQFKLYHLYFNQYFHLLFKFIINFIFHLLFFRLDFIMDFFVISYPYIYIIDLFYL
jgi:hypothetical protein